MEFLCGFGTCYGAIFDNPDFWLRAHHAGCALTAQSVAGSVRARREPDAGGRHSSRRNDIYNILWAVVFGFATLNILSLAARRFEPNRRGLTFGELLAVLVVLLSIFLLGWELLGVFRIFPIKLQR